MVMLHTARCACRHGRDEIAVVNKTSFEILSCRILFK